LPQARPAKVRLHGDDTVAAGCERDAEVRDEGRLSLALEPARDQDRAAAPALAELQVGAEHRHRVGRTKYPGGRGGGAVARDPAGQRAEDGPAVPPLGVAPAANPVVETFAHEGEHDADREPERRREADIPN